MSSNSKRLEIQFREIAPEISDSQHLGGEIEEGGFFASVPDQPIGIGLSRVFESCGEAQFRELVSGDASPFLNFYRRFDLWLIPHGVSIIRRKGLAEVISVGLEVQYDNEDRTCSIRSLFPSPEFVTHGRIAGSISASGESDLKSDSESDPHICRFAGMEFALKAKGSLSLNFNATVATPFISAVGKGSSKCEWLLQRAAGPLFGRDLEFWSILALPKRQRDLIGFVKFKARYNFSARIIAPMSKFYQSDWCSLTCKLDG